MYINIGAFAHAMEQMCPECGAKLNLTRVEDLSVAEYGAHYAGCGFENSLRLMRCGGCHGQKVFKWTGKLWRCIQCGHIRRNSSLPRAM